jgi:beta-lactamase regulating signal transducer with metallopeptidase domain
MNAEILNLWGEQALRFAWPMFWQSSLLILILFATDFLLRRKLRPAVRYGLWLLLLVKLILPPTLALPTSVAWWLRSSTTPTLAAGERDPRASIQAFAAPDDQPEVIYASVSSLSLPGTLLVGSVVGTLSLMSLAILRGRRTRSVRLQSRPPAELAGALLGAKRQAEFRFAVGLTLIETAASPAACGLLRPIILLPRLLAEQLPPLQLRAVLLHELFHFKRGDVWVNSLQALLQVVYWWHPLLWIANARVRRLREEAVDDAVVVALRGAATDYAAALVRVAKLALSPSSGRLGMVGIIQPKKPLRNRVERLLSSPPPKRAGLGVFALAGIAVFSAAALPMAQAPWKATPAVSTSAPQLSDSGIRTPVTEDPVVGINPLIQSHLAPGLPPDGQRELEPSNAIYLETVNETTISVPSIASAVLPEREPLLTSNEIISAPLTQEGQTGTEERITIQTSPSEQKPANSSKSEPPAISGDPMFPQVLPWVVQQDLEHLRARVHALLPPLLPSGEPGSGQQPTTWQGPPGIQRVLWETGRATTNIGTHLAGRVNTVLKPLVRVHNKATEIGILPKFLAIGPPVPTATNQPPPRRIPLLGDLPLIGRLFQLPPKTGPSQSHGKSGSPPDVRQPKGSEDMPAPK